MCRNENFQYKRSAMVSFCIDFNYIICPNLVCIVIQKSCLKRWCAIFMMKFMHRKFCFTGHKLTIRGFCFETSIPLQSPVWNLIKDKVTTNRVISSTEIENISILLNWTIFREKLLFSIKKYPDFLNAAYQNRWDSSYEITFSSNLQVYM